MKLRWGLLIGIILLGSGSYLYLLGDTLTGNVVWEPTTIEENCSDTQMDSLWNEVFVRPSTDATLLDAEGTYSEGCKRGMYEINGTEMWIMIVEESNYSYSYGTSRLGGTYIEMNSSSFIFYYYNLTYDIEVVLGIPTTNNALRTVTQLAPNSFSYWNVSTIPLARAKFAEHFSATSDSWMRGAYGDYYEFDEENNTKALDYIS